MNSPHETVEHTTVLRRGVLSHDNIECSIVALAPGEQITCEDGHWTQEHILFVIDGEVTVQTDDLTMFLKKEAAKHVAPGKHGVITADASGWAKLLRIDFAHRTVIEPPLVTVTGQESYASNR